MPSHFAYYFKLGDWQLLWRWGRKYFAFPVSYILEIELFALLHELERKAMFREQEVQKPCALIMSEATLRNTDNMGFCNAYI